jgi:hypothetical protein
MANGTYRNIQDIQVGDMVMGLHEAKTSGFRIAPTRVLNVINNGVKQTIKIEAGGKSLRCTPEHKIYVDDGYKTRWKRADSTIVGKTSVRLMDRKYPSQYFYKSLPKFSVENVSNHFEEEQVYDLTTECHSFIVEGFVVHNCESGRHGIIWDRLTRYEPLEIVEQQIKECYDLGYRALAYYDDILPLNKKRMLEIMEIHRKYDMIWRCFLRSDIINNHGGFEYMQAMAEGGLVEIFVGVESADNRIKEGITKKTTIEQDENIVKWCRELGIKCKLSFILGLPGESMESLNITRNWILSQDPQGLRIQVGRLIPFAGTPLTKKPENYDLKYETQIDDEWFYRGKMDLDSHSFVSTSHLTTAEIDTFWRNLENELDEKGYSK